MQELTVGSKQDEPPLEVDSFNGLFPGSMSFSLKPRAEDGRLREDEDGLLPDEARLIREELLSLL